MNLADAITAVETAGTQLSQADMTQSAAKTKADAAAAALTQADTEDAMAVATFNSAIDALITAANAAKRPTAPGTTIESLIR